MNKVYLKGNVGQDPKITTFEDGGKVAQFSVATTERGFKTRDGKEIPDRTDWHSVIVNKTGLAGGVVEKFVKKGTPVLIEGKLRTRSYEKDGETRYVTEVVVEELELCGGQKREEAPAPTPEDYTPESDDLPFPRP